MPAIKVHTEDLDSAVKRTVLDIIDFNYRFKNEENKSVKEVINESMSEIAENVTAYYDGIDIDIDLDIDQLADEYEAVMV